MQRSGRRRRRLPIRRGRRHQTGWRGRSLLRNSSGVPGPRRSAKPSKPYAGKCRPACRPAFEARGSGADDAFRPRPARVDAERVLGDEAEVAFDRQSERAPQPPRSEEHTSELQSLMRISYAVFCLKKKKTTTMNKKTCNDDSAKQAINDT